MSEDNEEVYERARANRLAAVKSLHAALGWRVLRESIEATAGVDMDALSRLLPTNEAAVARIAFLQGRISIMRIIGSLDGSGLIEMVERELSPRQGEDEPEEEPQPLPGEETGGALPF